MTLTLWCPLQDITKDNGGIRVIPGSHKINDNIEALGCEAFYNDIEQELIASYFIPLYPKAGECLIFDDTLLHLF
jgi:ectoine hydroxylase-related dioxygenase (phytanoyl-CoA dioxygenase family)